MTLSSASAARTTPARTAQHRRYLMCRPEHFTVSYRINPWMEPAKPTDTAKALAQWQALYDTYLALGHEVELIDPVPGLPDMVYTANGGFIIDGRALGAGTGEPVDRRGGHRFPRSSSVQHLIPPPPSSSSDRSTRTGW